MEGFLNLACAIVGDWKCGVEWVGMGGGFPRFAQGAAIDLGKAGALCAKVVQESSGEEVAEGLRSTIGIGGLQMNISVESRFGRIGFPKMVVA